MVVVEPRLLAAHHLDINDLRWSDLQAIDAGNAKFGPCKVSTLKDVLETVGDRAHQQIHIKGESPRTIPTLLGELGDTGNCLLTSFSIEALEEVKRRRADMNVGWIVKPDSGSGSEGAADLTGQVSARVLPPYSAREVQSILERSHEVGVDSVILCAPRLESGETVALFQRNGFDVGCWGIGSNVALARRLIAFGVDRFTIDNPEEL